jgi:hypothetical protein
MRTVPASMSAESTPNSVPEGIPLAGEPVASGTAKATALVVELMRSKTAGRTT